MIGASLTAFFMLGYPIAMALLGTENDEEGFWVAIWLAGMVGLWTSLIVNAGFGLMSMAPAKSANFFLTGQTVIGVLTWPFLILLRLAVTRIAGESNNRTDLIIAAISFTVAAAVVAGSVPMYLMKTRHHPVFAQSYVSGSNWEDIKMVFRAIRTPALCAWICGIGTWCVFPGQVSRWHPSAKDSYDTALYRSFLVYMFSIAEMIGRSSPQIFPKMLKVSDFFFGHLLWEDVLY